MPAPGRTEPKEAPTTRFSAQPNPSPAAGPDAAAPSAPRNRRAGRTARSSPGSATCAAARPATRVAPAPTAPQPSAGRDPGAADSARNKPSSPPPNEPQTPPPRSRAAPRENKDPDTATEKLNARGENASRNAAAAAGSARRTCCAARAASSREFASRLAFGSRVVRIGLHRPGLVVLGLRRRFLRDPWPATPGTRC